MQANRYDQAAEAPILNTYVPINFGELYRIGQAQKETVEDAMNNIGNAITTFGEFRSPSTIDTQNYYNKSIGQISDLIEKAAANPELIKDSGFRMQFQSRINNLDYASLSMLKESADMQRLGLQTRAQMQAEGRYNRNWDRSDIPNYDTLGTGRVFDDITPIRWMSANELSNTYFNDLKPSSLGSVWKDGVKYNRSGITYDTLYDISSARFNDLINTPQGKEYYNEFLQQYGNADQAKEAFVNMIADSQRDRIVNQDTVDPYWLATAKSNNGNSTIIRQNPTRLDFLNDIVYKSKKKKFGNRFGNYRNYIESLIEKYPNTDISKNAKQGLRNIDNMLSRMYEYSNMAQQYDTYYKMTGDTNAYNNAIIADAQAKNLESRLLGLANKQIMKKEFERVANFSADNKNKNDYSREGYLGGVKAALNLIKGDVGLMEKDDMLTGIGGIYDIITDQTGGKHISYSFNDSNGFILPETAFQMATETSAPEIKKRAGLFRDDSFPLKELIESGNIPDVQFIPDNKIMKIDPETFALSGKIRIPKESIQAAFGTGMWTKEGWFNGTLDPYVLWFGTQSTNTAMKEYFNAKQVTESVGENGKEYYELDILKTLPPIDITSEYWQRINQRWHGGSETGIGGTSQAKEEYYTSAKQTLSK